MDTARRAAEEAGRDPAELKCIVGAPSHISDDIADAREQSRWFPAMVSNHVMDLIERYGDDSEIPKDLTEFVKARKFYDYKDHSRVGAAHGDFVTDEIVDRFCVLGTPAEATAKLKELPGATLTGWMAESCTGSYPLSAVASSRLPAKDAPVNGQFLVLTVELALDSGPWLAAAPLIVGRATL